MAASRLSLLLWALLVASVSPQQISLSLPHLPEDTVYVYSYQSSTQISRDVSVDVTAEVSAGFRLNVLPIMRKYNHEIHNVN